LTSKELSQLYWLNREIEQDKQKLAELKAASIDTSSKITGLPHASGTSDKTSLAVEIVYLQGVIDAKLQQLYYEYNRLTAYISGIEDSYIRQIVTLRCVNGLNWHQVAMHIGGGNTSESVRQVFSRYIRKSCHTCHTYP
jgi:hypothetical protein